MGTSTGKNPFSKENAGGNQNDVTRTTLAPSNPPKPYAKGGSEMLQKLLMISEKTRRNLARQDAEAVEEQNVVKAEGNEKQEKQGKKRLVAVPLLGKPPKPSQARQEEQARPATTTTPDDVIDLVDSDDGAGDDCHAPTYTEANAGTQCPRSKSQTGVALFDIFDDGDDGDDGNVYFDDDEYYDDGDEGDEGDDREDSEEGEDGEDDDDDHRPQDPCPSLQEDLYGLPQEIGGQAWWRKLGDFQPISSIVQAGNRDARGAPVHVDFLAQFKGTRISSSPHGGARKSSKSKQGHWETRDGTRTFITSAGTAMTGLQAYREYSKAGTKRKTTGTKKKRRRKSSKKRRSG